MGIFTRLQEEERLKAEEAIRASLRRKQESAERAKELRREVDVDLSRIMAFFNSLALDAEKAGHQSAVKLDETNVPLLVDYQFRLHRKGQPGMHAFTARVEICEDKSVKFDALVKGNAGGIGKLAGVPAGKLGPIDHPDLIVFLEQHVEKFVRAAVQL